MPEGKSSLSCGMQCSRWLLFIFNGLFVIAGIIIIIIGAYSVNQLVKTNSPYGVAVFILVIGCIIFITAFFGCCGAIKKDRCLLITFGSLMIVILILCVAAVIAAFVLRNKTRDLLNTQLTDTIKTYYVATGDKKVWDDFQKTFHCCGVNNYTDWQANTNFSLAHSVPDSCCINKSTNCGNGQLQTPTKINKDGCLNQLASSSTYFLLIVGGIAAAIAIMMLLGIILAFCLASAVQDYQEV